MLRLCSWLKVSFPASFVMEFDVITPLMGGKSAGSGDALKQLISCPKGFSPSPFMTISISGNSSKKFFASMPEKDEPPMPIVSPGNFCLMRLIKYRLDVSWHSDTEKPTSRD